MPKQKEKIELRYYNIPDGSYVLPKIGPTAASGVNGMSRVHHIFTTFWRSATAIMGAEDLLLRTVSTATVIICTHLSLKMYRIRRSVTREIYAVGSSFSSIWRDSFVTSSGPNICPKRILSVSQASGARSSR